MRRLLEDLERQARRVGAEAVAVGATAEHEVEDALRPMAGRQRGEQLVGVSALDVGARALHRLLHEPGDDRVVERGGVGRRAFARHDPDEAQEDLGLGHLARLEVDHRWRVVRDVANREVVQGEGVAGAGERAFRRQDHVGVSCRLVAIDVDAHHEVE